MDVSRRNLLRAAGVGALAVGFTPAYQIAAQAADGPVSDLPAGLSAFRQAYTNWSQEIRIDALWTVQVRTAEQVVALANWAARNRFRLRAAGFRHTWAPLTVDPGAADQNVLIVDTTGMTGIRSEGSAVVVAAGTSMDALLDHLEGRGQGFVHNPAPGDITVGGMLAVGGHGAAVPTLREHREYGQTFGSLASLVLGVRAVVWDPRQRRYVERSFDRSDRSIGALLLHLGRAFITEVTLRVGARQRLRCRSYTDIPATELFAPQRSGGRTFASFLESAGRVEAIWFPFTAEPWLKVWSVAWNKPQESRATQTPYNYVFADNLPPEVPGLLQQLLTQPEMTPMFGQMQLDVTRSGLAATNTADLWGSASHLTRYVKPTTIPMTASGYTVLCMRSDVQWVISTYCQMYQEALTAASAQGRFPANGPVEIRVTGLDRPMDTGLRGAQDAWLSPSRRRWDRREWDVAVWLGHLTLPGTQGAAQFYADLEQFVWRTFNGSRSAVRVEWARAWGFTGSGAWTNSDVISGAIPQSLTRGQARGTGFGDAVNELNQLDPHRIYSSPLLDRLLPA